MRNNPQAGDSDLYRAAWRQHNFRVTPQREIIYRELCQTKIHPTAEQLHKLIQNSYPNISLDTVNRTLLTMAAIGLADVIETFGTARRYDGDITAHDHAHCISCGAIYDLIGESSKKRVIPESVSERLTKVKTRTIYSGICNKCRKKIKKQLT